jgi:hypothetical protein
MALRNSPEISKNTVKMLVMNSQDPGQKPGPRISAVTLFIVVLTLLLLTGGAVICVSLILSANAM